MHNTDDVDIHILGKLLERIRQSALDRRAKSNPTDSGNNQNSAIKPPTAVTPQVPHHPRVDKRTQPVPKKESKMMKAMTNIGKSFKKKREQVSFENDAFFLAHQAQENEGEMGYTWSLIKIVLRFGLLVVV